MMLILVSSWKLSMLSYINLVNSSEMSALAALTWDAGPPLSCLAQSAAFLQQSLVQCPQISQ